MVDSFYHRFSLAGILLILATVHQSSCSRWQSLPTFQNSAPRSLHNVVAYAYSTLSRSLFELSSLTAFKKQPYSDNTLPWQFDEAPVIGNVGVRLILGLSLCPADPRYARSTSPLWDPKLKGGSRTVHNPRLQFTSYTFFRFS